MPVRRLGGVPCLGIGSLLAIVPCSSWKHGVHRVSDQRGRDLDAAAMPSRSTLNSTVRAAAAVAAQCRDCRQPAQPAVAAEPPPSSSVKGSAWGSRWRSSTGRRTGSTGWSRSARTWSGCGRRRTRRTPIEAYSLTVEPADHFVNWQQDPFGNYLARLVFPERADRAVHHRRPGRRPDGDQPVRLLHRGVRRALPVRLPGRPGRRPRAVPAAGRRAGPGSGPGRWSSTGSRASPSRRTRRSSTSWSQLNAAVARDVDYSVRMEPGVQTPGPHAELAPSVPAATRPGCWSSLLRELGLAARFVSGYLVQLASDIDVARRAVRARPRTSPTCTPGPRSTSPAPAGSGWTRPPACSPARVTSRSSATPHPSTAAPITGSTEHRARSPWTSPTSCRRIHEDPRVTLPYTAEQWAADRTRSARLVDERLAAGDVRLTMGGEPTFVSIDDGTSAPSGRSTPTARTSGSWPSVLAERLRERLRRRAASCTAARASGTRENRCRAGRSRCTGGPTACRCGPTRRCSPTPGRPRTRTSGRADGRRAERPRPAGREPLDRSARRRRRLRAAGDPGPAGLRGRARRAGRAGPDAGRRAGRRRPRRGQPGRPAGAAARLDDVGHRADRAGCCRCTGWPRRSPRTTRHRRGSAPRSRRRSAGAAPTGGSVAAGSCCCPATRRPACGCRWTRSPGSRRSCSRRADPLAGRAAAARRRRRRSRGGRRRPGRGADHRAGRRGPRRTAVRLPAAAGGARAVRRADRGRRSAAAHATGTPVVLEGYGPPADPRLQTLSVTPDPGVIEVNVQPLASWDELVEVTTTLYEQARQSRLGTETFAVDGSHTRHRRRQPHHPRRRAPRRTSRCCAGRTCWSAC